MLVRSLGVSPQPGESNQRLPGDQSHSQNGVSHSWWVGAAGERDHGHTPGPGRLAVGQGAELETNHPSRTSSTY